MAEAQYIVDMCSSNVGLGWCTAWRIHCLRWPFLEYIVQYSINLSSGAFHMTKNGNRIHNGVNNLALFYNHLNLIEKAEQDGATLVKYSYLSDNTKLAALDAGANGLY